VAALAASELLLRVAFTRDRFVEDVAMTYRPDPVLLRVHAERSTGHNRAALPEDGFDVRYRYDRRGMRRNNEWLDARPTTAEPRIMLLGDSYIEQRQLADEDLLQTQLESMLPRQRSSQPRVFAYGVGQWSPLEYTLYYKMQARRDHPDILFVFLTFNDYRDDAIAWDDCRFAPNAELLSCPAPQDAYVQASGRLASSPAMLVDLYRFVKARRPWATVGRRLRDDLRTGSSREPDSDDLVGMFDTTRLPSTQPLVRRSFQVLEQLFDAARKDGVRPILVLIPWPQQVGPQEWALGRVPWGVPTNYLDPSTVFQDLTAQAARDTGITTIDLLPALREQSTRQRMFFPYDGHFTAAGARTVATVLATWIASHPDPR